MKFKKLAKEQQIKRKDNLRKKKNRDYKNSYKGTTEHQEIQKLDCFFKTDNQN